MKNGGTKEKIYNLLKDNANSFISGQKIANELYITRAGIWKAIKSLRDDGYVIEAVNNKGYCLITDSELLNETLIRSYLNYKNDLSILIYDEVESTNDTARSMELSGNNNDMVIVTDYQTKGRGRRGRTFHSPKGSGLYMSFLIHPQLDFSKATHLTCMSAVAICRAIKSVCNIDTSIKWVNDIFVDDRKVSGILTEGFTSMEDGSLSYVIIGIGININIPKNGFPDDIKKTAGALYKKAAPENIKNMLCAAIIDNFMELYHSDNPEFIDEYRNRSNLIGHYVKVNPTEGADDFNGYALVKGINDDCHLVVQYENGNIEALSNGEVSVVKY